MLASAGKTISDVIAPDLRVLFCGINPGLYSGATGHHFARPGNRFWPALLASGFTDRLLSPAEKRELLKDGYGITNVIARTTASETDLRKDEYAIGARRLRTKLRRYQPKFLAVLGIGAYRVAFNKPKAILGRQEEKICDTIVWVLPNPSGLNAHYQAKELARLFRELREAVDIECSS
ncbi:MAG: G/U mismatch-specific DNA glycosylase [Pyrinomonadaceae bacterium]